MAARTKVFVDIVTKSAGGKTPGAGLKKFAIAAAAAAVAVGVLIKVGKELVNIFAVQEQAEAKLIQTIKATGKAAGLTSKALFDMASGLQEVTKFGDEAIIGAQSLLLTFKDIGGDIFPRALESILDVSEAMGTGLKESTIQLGKALNDPIGGIASLTRVGIQFTDEQKNMIKSLVETGDKAAAQTIILEELESQFGGVARAAADTSTGSLTQLNNTYGDIQETLGQVISEGIQPFVIELNREISVVNSSIKAHFLRGKALRGEATVIEELILRELEQADTEDRLVQAKKNLEAAEASSNDLSKIGIGLRNQIEQGKERAITNAKNLIIGLEDELVLRRMTTDTAQKQFDSEQKLLDVKLAAFVSINDLNESTKDLNESLEEESDILEGLEFDWETFDGIVSDSLKGQSDAVKELEMDYEALAKDGLGAFASAFEEVGAGNLTLWEGVKEAGKDAISALLKSYAQLWIAQAAAAAALFRFGVAAKLTLAAAGALAASGFVQSLATGGQFITDGPTIVGNTLVGDNASGQERITVEPLGGGGGNNTGQIMILRVGDRDLKAVVQGWIDNRGLHSSFGGAI